MTARPRLQGGEVLFASARRRVPRLALVIALFGLMACAAPAPVSGKIVAEIPAPTMQVASAEPTYAKAERALRISAHMQVEVKDATLALARAREQVEAAGGYVIRQQSSGQPYALLEARVPAAELRSTLKAFEELGETEGADVTAEDVADQLVDLAAVLETKRALRDRLRSLLERAREVKDVLAVEQELTRLQAEIEHIEAQLERLRVEVALSAIALRLVEPFSAPRAGPGGYVIKAVSEALEWFFRQPDELFWETRG